MADQQAIIIKKVKKGGHGGHHGGAWKIAYADFVTAMMAFFLLLWLLNAVSQAQLEGIADYFAPTVASVSQSGSGKILGGTTVAVDGSQSDTLSRPTVTMNLPPPKAGSGGASMQDAPVQSQVDATQAQVKAKAEQTQFAKAQQDLKAAMKTLPEFQKLAKSLMVENTPEGLRIQILDQDGLPMFPSGGFDMYPRTQKLIALVAGVINKMPQDIAISGHTDSVPMGSGHNYTNWELSTDRANAARRSLVSHGVPESRISRVVGKAATDPLLVNDPTNARNRRLSIVLLRGTGKPPAPRKPPPSIINPGQ